VKMLVYSSKTRRVREVELVPSHQWGGQGLLGVSIRSDALDNRTFLCNQKAYVLITGRIADRVTASILESILAVQGRHVALMKVKFDMERSNVDTPCQISPSFSQGAPKFEIQGV